jgi:hypothetical protein
LQRFIDPYAAANGASERNTNPHIDADGEPDCKRGTDSLGRAELISDGYADAHRDAVAFSDANSDANSDADANCHADTDTDTDTDANTDANANTNTGCHHAFHKLGATRDRWIDHQSGHQRVAVQCAAGADADALMHGRSQ